jgi:hypothetical protein
MLHIPGILKSPVSVSLTNSINCIDVIILCKQAKLNWLNPQIFKGEKKSDFCKNNNFLFVLKEFLQYLAYPLASKLLSGSYSTN